MKKKHLNVKYWFFLAIISEDILQKLQESDAQIQNFFSKEVTGIELSKYFPTNSLISEQ